jgi:hypothetical protein
VEKKTVVSVLMHPVLLVWLKMHPRVSVTLELLALSFPRFSAEMQDLELETIGWQRSREHPECIDVCIKTDIRLYNTNALAKIIFDNRICALYPTLDTWKYHTLFPNTIARGLITN